MFEREHNELWRAWTIQLALEHRQLAIRYGLRDTLDVPLIRIAELASNWATWSRDSRTITLSARLLREYPWDIVIEVLKHEIAHQIVSDFYGDRDVHGDAFRSACARLAVAPWATSASGALPTDIPRVDGRATSDEDEKLLRRAEKLLALGASSNEHEALLAMARVRELFARHNLDRLKHARASRMVSKLVSQKKKRLTAAEMTICSILNSHFFVHAILVGTYDAPTNTHHRGIELLGTHGNVVMAEFVYEFLLQEVQTLWREYRARTGCAARMQRSYALGLLNGFREKLKTQSSSTVAMDAADSNTLMVLSNKELEQFTRQRYPRLGHSRCGGGIDGETFHAGKADGANITINRPIQKSHGNAGRLLT